MITDDTIEVGEATLAVVGLTNVLKGDMPRMGVGKQREVVEFSKTIDKAAEEFVYDRFPGKLTVPRPFAYRSLLERFTKPLSQAEIDAIIKKFPEDAMDTALSFISTLQRAYDSLAEIVPVADYNTYLGPKHIMPTSDKLTDFYLLYWVIDNPLVTFQLMARGALLPEQVTQLIEFFPSLYNYMKKATLDALLKRNLREPSFLNLPPRADRGLATFKRQRIVPFGPNIHAAPEKPPAQPMTAPPPKVNTSLETTAQKAANL